MITMKFACVYFNKQTFHCTDHRHQSKTQQPSSICLLLCIYVYIYMFSYGYRMVTMAPGTVTNPSIQNISCFQEQIKSSCISPFTFLHPLSLASESKTRPLAVMWLLNWRAPTEHEFSGACFYLSDLWSAALAVRGFRVISTRQKRSNQPLHSKRHFRLGQNVSFVFTFG